MVHKKYTHIFFDLDHTLWDFDKNSKATLWQLYQEYDLKSMGIHDFESLFISYNEHNDRLWDRYRKGFINREELRWKRMWLMLLDHKIASTSLAHELSSAYLEILPTQTLLLPNTKTVLDHCTGKYEMNLITNGFETTQRLKLQYSGISKYFTHLITSEKSNSIKPHRDIFEFALKTSGAEKDASIMVGDAVDIDILGAENAGIDSVYFNPAGQKHQRNPTYEIADLIQLLDIL